MPASRKRLASAAALAVVASGLLLVPSAPAGASVSEKISSFPYTQNWSALTGTSTWADFPGVEGFTAGTTIAGSNLPNSTDVGTLTAEGTLTSSLIHRAGNTPNGDSNGGVLAYASATDKTVALSATGSVTTPLMVFHLDTTGESGIGFSYDIQDLDSGTDDQPTRVALQYRVGTSGAYTNIPGAYVTDATVASNPTVTTTPVSAALPAAVDDQADVYVRVITLDNASGSNEHVGIDNISITSGGAEPEPDPLEATSPGNQTGTVGVMSPPITLAATGGSAPYSWEITGLPDGLEETEDGVIGGAPTVAGGPVTVTATVTDDDGATDDVTFDYTVEEVPETTPIAEIQGDGARAPLAPPTGNGYSQEVLTTEGVVTALYPQGGINGMYIQTPGVDTEGASDGIFVYGGGGNTNIPADVQIGDSVLVTGRIAEFYDLTQIVPASANAIGEFAESLGEVEPRAIAYPATDEDREAREGELLAPTGDFTVTNNYSTNGYAEIGLAAGTTPLRQPTEYAAPGDTAAIEEIKADNYARGVVLDDASTTNFLQNQTTKAIPLPWLTPTNPIRVGAAVTFTGPVVLDWRYDAWRFEPTEQVTDDGADVATFEDTREDNLVPQSVGGDLSIATFNVLNYFNTTGEAYVAAGPLQSPPVDTHCTYYTDRGPGTSQRITNNQCGTRGPGIASPNDGRGPRGAATAVSLARQEAKLGHTINTLDADIIGLEEVENSIKLPGETNRDDALARIVEIANQDAGENKWAYVKSPGKALTAAAIGEQDVIRGAFMYQRDTVETVGQSDMLFGTTQFANAREPLAQAFKAKGAPDGDAFGVIVNHFKSKGDNQSPNPPAEGDNANDSETGVGAFNGDRVRQAERLVQFADDFAADRDIEAIFLAGDFNAYTMEDPIKALEEGGYELIESDDPDDESYSFSGLSGSLDHVLGNEAAVDMYTGADIWEINADESVAFQYSRYNYNVRDFWQPELPFATSDHNPEIVGIDVPDFESSTYREIQILGTNDFHGRLLPDGGNAAGAAPFATAVEELRSEVPESIFVAAGDLVGASTFESFIQDDEPTIDALNAMDLEVSAVGNHEFDKGYDDLVGRIMDRAQWEYIATNVEEPNGQDELAETFTRTFDTEGDPITVGFVGAVTEDLPALVNPAGIEGVTVTDIVDATNDAAEELKADGADLVVLLVHEGSPSTTCGSDSFTDPATTWGNIVQNTSSDVDAIISGHTHLAYNCRFTVEDWVDDERAVTKRPVVSAGQYGTNLNKLVFRYDESGELAGLTQDVVATAGVGYAPDEAVQAIVDDAVEYAEAAGAEVLGQMDGPFNRAQYLPSSGATENRGGESTLGNRVAEVQRWATEADLAFMNPGGLRADMVGTADGELRDLTYRQAADVQPFANTLVSMELTGAQIETVLEQQWQRNAQGGVPSRPFLRLGVSEGFTYTYVETPETVSVPNAAPVETFQGEVTGMWLDGEPIDPAATYTVTVNSFLATGGDNFWELAEGAGKVDTGKVDLEAMVDYMEQFDEEEPLPVDYSQRAVEVAFPNDAPEVYASGDTLSFDVASWTMSAPGDVTDDEIVVMLGETEVGRVPVDNTIGTDPYDSYGTAEVEVTVPAVADGRTVFTLVGDNTGTEIPVTVRTQDDLTDTTLTGEDQSIGFGEGGSVPVAVDPADATGTVTLLDGSTELGQTTLAAGAGTISFGPGLAPGTHELRLVYAGDSTHNGAEGTVTVTVGDEPPPTTTPTTTGATAGPMTWGTDGSVTVTVTPAVSGAVTLSEGDTQVATGTVTNGSGTVTIDGEALEPGVHTLTVRFAGSATHDPSQTTVTVEVAKAATSLSATTAPVDYGSAAAVSVTATPETATGAVTVSEGDTTLGEGTLEGGTDVVTVPAGLEPGTHTLTVRYAGDERHAEATTTVTLAVRKAASTTAADVSPRKIEVAAGEATVAVTVAAGDLAPTGTVVAIVNGDVVDSASLSDGAATLSVGPFSGTGEKSIRVRYSGDDHIGASSATASVKVVKAEPSVDVDHRPAKVKAGKTRVKLTVKVAADGFTRAARCSCGSPASRTRRAASAATARRPSGLSPSARAVRRP